MFDPYDTAYLADPYPALAALRRETPIFHDERWGLTFFTRHADISAILRDRSRFGRDVRHRLDRDEVDAGIYDRIYPSAYPHWARLVRDSFIDLEPPRHTRMRRLVSKAFTRRASEEFRPRLASQAEAIVRCAVEQGELEVIADLATPVPLAMIAELMGIPGGDQEMLVAWSHAIVRLFEQNYRVDEGEAGERAVIEFAEYLAGLLEDRRRRPADDLLSSMLAVEDDGERLTDEEIVATSILTLNAGHEATVHAIGNGLLALARRPDSYRALRADPALVPTAASELLRFDSPLQMFERWVLEDVDWDGRRLAAGSKVGLLFGAGNHDPGQFEDPTSLDLARDPNPHLSFGAGIHFCVGAPLALVELEAVLNAVVTQVGTLELLTDQPPRIESLVFRGVRRLPLAVTTGR